MPSCGVRPSVRLSAWVFVAFVYSLEPSKHIRKLFLPSGSHIILFFSIPNVIAYLDRDISKSRFSTNIWLWHRSDAGPSRVVNNSTVDYRLYYLCVVRLPRSTNSVPRVRVNLVYDRKPRRYTEENRVEFNYTHWII